MERKDLKVGDTVRVTRSLNVAAGPYGNVYYSSGKRVTTLPAGTLLECIRFGVGRFHDKHTPLLCVCNSDTRITANALNGFELASDASNKRQTNSRRLASKIATNEANLQRLQDEISRLSQVIESDKARLSSLERFASDDEELAFTLAEVIRAGADEKAILELLKARTSTDRL